MCLFGVSSGSLPVLVRTRMMASKPMLFCTSFLRSLRKCSPSTSTCSVKQRARHRDTLHAHQSFDQQMAALTHSDRSERAAPGSCCTCRRSRQCARARQPWWPGLHTGWGRGRGPRSSPVPHTLWTAARTLLSEAGTGSGAAQQKLWMRSSGWWSSTARSKVLTFSFSVLTSFLSSLFFSLPGASAVGMDEWKRKSLPLHSAAWGRERRAS